MTQRTGRPIKLRSRVPMSEPFRPRRWPSRTKHHRRTSPVRNRSQSVVVPSMVGGRESRHGRREVIRTISDS
jgi:hypothetical protein